MSAATEIAIEFAARADSADHLVRWLFDSKVSRYTRKELAKVAADLGVDPTGTRSSLAYRVARHLVA